MSEEEVVDTKKNDEGGESSDSDESAESSASGSGSGSSDSEEKADGEDVEEEEEAKGDEAAVEVTEAKGEKAVEKPTPAQGEEDAAPQEPGSPASSSPKGSEGAEVDLEASSEGSESESDFEDDDDDDMDEESESEEGEEIENRASIDEESEGGNTVTTVSNETDVDSDFSINDIERQPAQIFPEPPWSGMGSQATKVAVSCLLPFMLVLLVLYGLYKFLQISFQCFFDSFTVGTKLVWLLIRLVLSPFNILYHLITPHYIKKHVSSTYDQHIGRRVRVILKVKRFIVRGVLDIPFIMLSCAMAFVETCVFPAKDGCKSCSWNYFGQHIFKHIMSPMYAHHINVTSKQKRKHVDASRKDQDMRASRLRYQKKAKKRKQMQHERAKKMRKKRTGAVEVQLAVPAGDIDLGANLKDRVTLRDKNPIDYVSRTMIIERRYAVAIGFFWSLAGLVMIIILLDGQRGERCEICAQNEELNVVVCRHGIGRDCSFSLHRFELMVGIAVSSMGNIVMIYATFLYKPHGGAQRASEQERVKRLKAKEDRESKPGKKMQDPDTQAIDIVKLKIKEPTLPKVLKLIYRHTPFHSIADLVGGLMNEPLKKLYKFEKSKKWAARSIKATERFTTWAEKYIIDVEARNRAQQKQLKAHLAEHGIEAARAEANFQGKGSAIPELKRMGGHSSLGLALGQKKKRGPIFRALYILSYPLVLLLAGFIFVVGRSPCLPCLEKMVDRCPPLKRVLVRIVIWEKVRRGDEFADGHHGSGSLRGQAGTGPSILEDVLDKYGFKTAKDEDGEEEEKKIETEDERRERLKAEKPDPLGHVETLREAGGKDDIQDEDDLEPTLAELAASSHEDIFGAHDEDSNAEFAHEGEEGEEEVVVEVDDAESEPEHHEEEGLELDLEQGENVNRRASGDITIGDFRGYKS